MDYPEYMEYIKNALLSECEELFIAENGYSADCKYSPDDWLAIQHIIWAAATGDIKGLIKNQSRFAREYLIPLRTVQDWYRGINQCPAYLIIMLGFTEISVYHG